MAHQFRIGDGLASSRIPKCRPHGASTPLTEALVHISSCQLSRILDGNRSRTPCLLGFQGAHFCATAFDLQQNVLSDWRW